MNFLSGSFLTDKKKFILLVILVIAAEALLQIFLYAKGYYSFSADESGRTLLAYKWLNNGYSEIPTWLPFHTVITAGAIKLLPDLFWTPRILGSLFGLSAFIILIWLTHEMFRDRNITLCSAVIGCFFPPRLVLSVVPLTESMFFFFILAGLAFFVRWLAQKGNYNLVSAAAAVAFSSSVRYEGWIFALLLPVIYVILVLLRKEKVKAWLLIVILVFVLAFPLYWLSYNLSAAGNPLFFLFETNERYQVVHGTTFFSILKNNFLTRFLHHNLIYILFPGIISGAYLFFRESRIRGLLTYIMIPFLLLIAVSLTGRGMPTHNMWRTPELWNIILIPFTAYFLVNLNNFRFKLLEKIKIPVLPFLILFFVIYYSGHIQRLTDEPDESVFHEEEIDAGRYFEKQQGMQKLNQEKILIEVSDWSYLNIFVSSNNPDIFIKNSELKGFNYIISPDDENIDITELREMNIRYLLFKDTEFKKIISRNPFVKTVKHFDQWTLYEFHS